MVALGTPAPAFRLPDVVSGEMVGMDSFSGKKGLLVMFICRHCPYVRHVQKQLSLIGRDYESKPLGIVAISSNDAVAFPEDAPGRLREMAEELDFRFPFCYDESQEVARAYQAVCTPDFYLFDERRRLVYRGQLDGSRPRNDTPVTGSDLRAAIDALLSGEAIGQQQTPSLGCNIKWRG